MADHRRALARLLETAADGRLDEICDRHGVAVLGAFGSASKPDGPTRDLDLAVAFRADSPRDLLGLWSELSLVSGAGDTLDLLDLRAAPPVARAHGLAGVPLFEHEKGAYHRMQVAAALERMNTAWLRRLELDLLAGR